MIHGAIPHPSPAAGVDAQNPWPGLVAFTEDLRDFFHGRADETDELLRRVGRRDLTVLFGQSGLGKSSLLQAGLFPRLRAEGYLPIAIRLDHAPSAPPQAGQVKAAVARAVQEAGGQAPAAAPDADDALWEHFHRRAGRPETSDGRPFRLVLVFDQFEELFAIGQASPEARERAGRFLTELADLFENRPPEALERRLELQPELVKQFALDDQDHRALICLREDYLPHLESLCRLMPSVAENRMRLTRMDGVRALEAVLNAGGRLVTPEVGRQIVRFVAGGERRGRPGAADPAEAERDEEALAKLEIEPSLLSLVCRELNNRRLELGLPQITAELLAGNRDCILQDFYERCVADQLPAVRSFVENELVTDSGLRENMVLERARKALAQHGAPPAAIDELVRRRLLHLEDRLDVQSVELTHDVLTPVIKRSREERQQTEATLRAEQQARKARDRARRQQRWLCWTVAAMAAALAVAVGAFSAMLAAAEAARRQESDAQQAAAKRADDLAGKLTDAGARIEQLQIALQEAQKRSAGLELTVRDLKSDADRRGMDLAKLQEGSDKLLAENARAADDLRKSQADYSAAKREFADLALSKDKLESDYAAARKSLAALTASNDKLGSDNERLAADLKKTEDAFAELKESVAKNTEVLTAKLDDAKKQLEEARAQLAKLHPERTRLALDEAFQRLEKQAEAASKKAPVTVGEPSPRPVFVPEVEEVQTPFGTARTMLKVWAELDDGSNTKVSLSTYKWKPGQQFHLVVWSKTPVQFALHNCTEDGAPTDRVVPSQKHPEKFNGLINPLMPDGYDEPVPFKVPIQLKMNNDMENEAILLTATVQGKPEYNGPAQVFSADELDDLAKGAGEKVVTFKKIDSDTVTSNDGKDVAAVLLSDSPNAQIKLVMHKK